MGRFGFRPGGLFGRPRGELVLKRTRSDRMRKMPYPEQVEANECRVPVTVRTREGC